MSASNTSRWAKIAAALSMGVALPLLAHHSFAPYDMQKTKVLTGVVTRVNPDANHLLIYFAEMNPERTNVVRDKDNKLPKGIWLTSDQVAKLGVDAVEAGKPRIVTGMANNVIAALSKYLPNWLASALIGSRSKDFRDAD